MSNAEVAASSTSSKDRAPVDVDPAILAVIKSASVPVGWAKYVFEGLVRRRSARSRATRC